MRIEDIRELLRRYPVVAEVPLEQPEEFTRAGMVRVKFHGDKEVGMALGLFDQRPGESRQEWKERLDHIVNGWAVEEISEVVDVEQAVPVVRSVDYFMPRGRFRTPMWDRLTEFIGMGLAIDTPSQIQFLNSSDLPEDRSPENVARLRERACINLVNLSQPPLVQELPHGPDVVTFHHPARLPGILVRTHRGAGRRAEPLPAHHEHPMAGDPGPAEGPGAHQLGLTWLGRPAG